MKFSSQVIRIYTSGNCIADIYSAIPKIIVAEQELGYLIDNINLPKTILSYKFSYDRTKARGIILPFQTDSSSVENVFELKLVPNFLTGLIIFTPPAKAELKILVDWLTNHSQATSAYNFIELNPQQEASQIQANFWQQMYAITDRETQAITTRNAKLQQQYLHLRTLHEDMQNAFATVEEFLTQAKLPELQLAFDNQPITKLIQPGDIAQSNSLTVKQLLPISSRGIAAIDLRVANTDKNSIGNLIVQLKYCENQTSFARWQVPYTQISSGWLSLDVPQIDIGRKRDVELIINCQTQAGTAPYLILGESQLIPELRAYCNENPIEYSLSFRVWQGLPGTRKVTSPYLESADSEIKLGFLGQGVMAGVKELTAQTGDNFAHVQAIHNGAKIMTHPRVNGDATVAILPFSFSSQANYLTATVITEHPEADTMEYALAIVSPEVNIGKEFSPQATLAHSGWVAVPANTPRQISLYLQSAPAQNCHIAIAARLAADSKPNCAWCRWLNFKLESRSHNPQATKPQILRNASLDSAQESFPRVQQLNDKGKIQVHPKDGIDTVAVLVNAVPQDTEQIKAIVCTPNEQADTIEYAMAAIEEDDDTQARLAVTNPETAIAFTGWHRVAPNTPYRLNLELPSPTTNQCHLVLTTRIPQGSIQSHAWARWLEIQYRQKEAGGRSLVGNE